MHNSNRRSGRGAKTGTGRAGRGSGKNSVPPQNASPPITSPKTLQGLYANPPFVYVASVARGCVAELQVKSGKKFEGILTTISPSGEIELRTAHAIDPNDTKAIPSPDQVTEKMLFKASSIVCIEIKDVDLDYANRGAEAFQTDAEIAARRQNGQATERELEVWQGDSDSKDGGLGSENENGWSAEDMFRKNEQLGVTSSYDSNLGDYTTPLMKEDTEEYHRKMEKATRLAREIESSSDFRNRANLEASEEEQFSAVVRPHGPPRPGHSSSPSPVSASSNAESLNTGRYVPPALRGKQGDGLSGGSGPSGHHRNLPRGGATPPGLSMQSAGRARAQSPHMQMHPSQHPQQPHPAGQTSPHGLPLPQQRVTTPPHGHPASRGAQMQIPSPQQVAAQHATMTQRTPPGLPQPQAPLPQRIPVTGRRTAADVVQGSFRSPVQSAVPATAAIVDKHSNVVRDDKLREGAGLPDVDKKSADVSQPQRAGPPQSDRSPRPDPAKNATYAQLRDFKDNFRLPDKDKAGPAAPTVSTSATPQQLVTAPTAAQPAPAPTQQTQHPSQQPTQQKPPQQQQQPQQPPPPAVAASQPPAQLTLQSQTAVTPTAENKEPAKVGSPSSPPNVAPTAATASNPASPAAPTATSVAATAATASTTKPAEKPATSSPSEPKKEEETIEMIVKKSNLNPNAKEFNPQAKPFVPQRIQPQKTPTPPRPPSQPSPVIPSPGQYTQPINQSIYQAMTLHPQQNLHYQSMKYINPRKGATNLPQPRGHQPDIHPILPVSMAAGQPLVTPMPAHMSMLPFGTPQPGGGAPVSSAQPINHQVISHQVMQQQPLPYHVYSPKQMTPRLANQQSMAAAGQPGSHGQHQLSQDSPVMVFPQPVIGNIPISQQNPNQGVHPPFHQFSQPQPQPQPHQNPTAHLQHQPHQHQQHQHQPHPHGHQHTTPPQAHTPQGQNQGNVMQQPQPHGGRPSPSPVNQVMHQASPQVLQQSRSQQQQQQPQQQQQQAFHPQGMQAMHQQPQNAQMMAAVAAVNQQNAAGTAPHSTGNHSQQQQQNMMQHIHPHPHIIHYQPATNITNVTPVHSTPHPHPKTVFLHSTQGQQGAAGQPQVQAIHMHSQPPIMSSPVQGHYMQPQGQLQPAQVQQYQPNN